jgi:Na+/H+ antiporter NhaD/arsenite permease-like protein
MPALKFFQHVVLCGLLCCGLMCISSAWTQEKSSTNAEVATSAEKPVTEKPAEKHDHEHDHDDHAASSAAGGSGHSVGHDIGVKLPLWTVLPFAVLLLCIAVLPLASPHWWEHNSNKAIVVALLSIPLAAYLLTAWNENGVATHGLIEKIEEYISFMVLLGALYVISGGIYIKGSLNGTPLSNTAIMGIGAVIASLIGTTGASVLLIRPLLRANQSRKAKAHIVVFFIFVVSNCGGLLTPLGDPPLFLGFLKGVPFEWTVMNLWQQWLLVNVALLVIFNIYDQIVLDREEKAREGSQLEAVMKHEPIGVDGGLNFLFLAAVVGVIIASGQGWGAELLGVQVKPGEKVLWPWGVQELLMFLICLAAYFTTSGKNREANKFTFGPIIEVAVLFIGIFITMAPALLILNAWGNGDRVDLGKFGIVSVWQYFWATGILSSFLDNAPTYLTFAATACGQHGIDSTGTQYLGEFVNKSPETVALLKAISCGAVFMGANTYIGNGPNFMVKAIAEENDVKMPSFFGYMAYSGAILIPIFVVVTLVFFRG